MLTSSFILGTLLITYIRNCIKILIRKLPTNLFCILAHHEIPYLRTLINIAKNDGIYEEHANAHTKLNFEKKK